MNKLQISLLVIISSTVIPKMQISLPEVVEAIKPSLLSQYQTQNVALEGSF